MTVKVREELLLTISNFVSWPLMPGTSAGDLIDTHRQARAKEAVRALERDPHVQKRATP